MRLGHGNGEVNHIILRLDLPFGVGHDWTCHHRLVGLSMPNQPLLKLGQLDPSIQHAEQEQSGKMG